MIHPDLLLMLRQAGLDPVVAPTDPVRWNAFLARLSDRFPERDPPPTPPTEGIAPGAGGVGGVPDVAGVEPLRSVVSALAEGLLAVDRDGGVLLLNPSARRLLGMGREGPRTGEGLLDRFTLGGEGGEPLRGPALLALALSGGSRRDDDARLISTDGSVLPVNCSLTPLEIGGGIAGALLVFSDVSERRHMLESLAQALSAAEGASRAKSEFMAMMSHEIRTPLNAILGMGELLAATPLSDEQRSYLEVFNQAGQMLSNLIGDVLDLALIESGRLRLDPRATDLRRLLQEGVGVHAREANAKGLTLELELSPRLPTWVRVDPRRLRQILLNLLGNAVKFTQRGGVRVVMEPHSPDRLCLAVEDSGSGIAPELLEEIVHPFSRADSPTRPFGGAGLGLTICRRVAQEMGGHLEVASVEGEGSRFALIFPAPVEEAPLPGAARGRIGGVLQRGGVLERRGADPIPGAVPVPGSPVVERATPLPGSAPVAGPVDAPLAGPVDAPVAGPVDALPDAGSAATGGRSLQILVVEDAEDNLFLLHSFFKGLPWRLRIARDGSQGVEAFRNDRFDLVLMDIQMPVMDGHQATRLMREWERERGWGRTPILALTAHAFASDVAASREAGCDDHIPKPVRKGVLLEIISRHCALGRGGGGGVVPGG